MATETSIPIRAFEAVHARADEKGISFNAACNELGVSRMTVNGWKRNGNCPLTLTLAEMCKQGYDIPYILTGEKKDNG